MKARLEHWTDLQSGVITLYNSKDEEIGMLRFIGLSNLPDVKKFNERHKALAESVVISVNGYEGEIPVNE